MLTFLKKCYIIKITNKKGDKTMKKHTRIITEPDGTKVELDYSFSAFMDMLMNHPPDKAAASIRRNRSAKRAVKNCKRAKRQTRVCSAALAANHAIKDMIRKS